MPAPTFTRPIQGSAPNQFVQTAQDEAAINAALQYLWNAILANSTEEQIQSVLDAADAADASAMSAALSSAAAGIASGRLEIAAFADMATRFVYATPGAGQEIAAAGDVIVNRENGNAYLVLASGASGAHIDYTGSGGIKAISLDQLSQQKATGVEITTEKPALSLPKNVDIFIAYGQSNAAGSAPDTTDKYDVPTAYGYLWNISGGTLDALVDPTRVDGQDKGSAWPAFASEWARINGRPAVIINAAIGGRTVQQLEPGQTPDYYQDMEDATKACITYLNANGYQINSCSMIWSQGEQDAFNEVITGAAYVQNVQDIHLALSLEVPEYQQLYIAKTGFNWNSEYSEYAEFLQRRLIREAVIKGTWSVCFVDANRFNRSNGLLSSADFVHYSQMGYNLMGIECARNITEERMYGTATGRLIMQDELSTLFQPFQANNGDDNTETSLQARLVRQDAELVQPNAIRWFADRLDIHGNTGLVDLNGNVRVKVLNTNEAEVRSADGNMVLRVDNGGVRMLVGGVEKLSLRASGNVEMIGLPTSSPGGAGRVWNDGGTLKIT